MAEKKNLINQWIRATWRTPYAVLLSLPEAEEEFGILFIAWALGWNVSFGGKKIQLCWAKWTGGPPGSGIPGQMVPSGYRWNPFTRSCEKIPQQQYVAQSQFVPAFLNK